MSVFRGCWTDESDNDKRRQRREWIIHIVASQRGQLLDEQLSRAKDKPHKNKHAKITQVAGGQCLTGTNEFLSLLVWLDRVYLQPVGRSSNVQWPKWVPASLEHYQNVCLCSNAGGSFHQLCQQWNHYKQWDWHQLFIAEFTIASPQPSGQVEKFFWRSFVFTTLASNRFATNDLVVSISQFSHDWLFLFSFNPTLKASHLWTVVVLWQYNSLNKYFKIICDIVVFSKISGILIQNLKVIHNVYCQTVFLQRKYWINLP